MPPGTLEILAGLGFAALVLGLFFVDAVEMGADRCGAVDVVATRSDEGVRVVLKRYPTTKGVVVLSVGVSRELADATGLRVPDGYRVRVDRRWLSAEGRVSLREPVELLFPATEAPSNPPAGVLRVVSRYRPRLRRIRHYVQVNIDPGSGGVPDGRPAALPTDPI